MAVVQGVALMGQGVEEGEVELNEEKNRQRAQVINLRAMQARSNLPFLGQDDNLALLGQSNKDLKNVNVIMMFQQQKYAIDKKSYYLSKKQGKLVKNESFWQSSFIKFLAIEIILNAVHNMPHINYVFAFTNINRPVRYSINTFLVIIMMNRIYLFLRLITVFTRWRSDQAELICQIEGFQANTSYALKALMQDRPYSILTLMFVVSSILFGFAVRLMEIPYYEDTFIYQNQLLVSKITTSDSCNCYQDYTSIWNGWWLVVVTMTTVGFGDFYAKTYFGRFFTVMACFIGVFIVSLTMVAMNKSKDFSLKEGTSFTLLRRLSLRKNINRLAAQSILYFLRSIIARSKQDRDPENPIHKNDLAIMEEGLDRYIEQFKMERQILQPDEVPQEEKLRMLIEKIDLDIIKIAIDLEHNLKGLKQIDNLLISQSNSKIVLKSIFTNFRKMEIIVNRLDQAQKFGPLKILNHAKKVLQKETTMKLAEIQNEQVMLMKKKSQLMTQYSKKDVHQILADVSDTGNMSKIDLERKLTSVKNYLYQLKEEENFDEKQGIKSFASSPSGRSPGGNQTFQSSDTESARKSELYDDIGPFQSDNNSRRLDPRHLKNTSGFSLRQSDTSVSMVSNEKKIKQIYNMRKSRVDSFGTDLSEIESTKSPHHYTKLIKDPDNFQEQKQIYQQNNWQKFENNQSIQNYQQHYQSSLSNSISKSSSPQKAKINDIRSQSNQNKEYVRNKIQDRQLSIEYIKKQQEMQSDSMRIIQRGGKSANQKNEFTDLYGANKKQQERAGYQPAYIQKQLQQNTQQNQVPSFVEYYKNLQKQKEDEYDNMMKMYTAYGMYQDNQKNGRPNKQNTTVTSEEMKQRWESRSSLGTFKKALKTVLKPPTT